VTRPQAGAFAATRDGVRLYYRVQGRPGAPWLVLLNALLTDATLWAGALPHLTPRFRVLTFDGRGQGRSDAPAEGPYTPAQLAADAWDLMAHLDIRRPGLAGLSNGGAVGLELLAAHPGEFRGAVLAAAPPRTDLLMTLRLQHWLRCLELGGPALQFEAAAPWLWGERYLESRYSTLKNYFLNNQYSHEPSCAYRHQIAGVLGWDICSRLGAIQDPLLLLAGSADLLTPPWKCMETARLVNHSRFELVEGMAHAYPVESPQAFARKVVEFLQYD
jgi:pimeloyl-ACP methyl ester carboxylesterase